MPDQRTLIYPRTWILLVACILIAYLAWASWAQSLRSTITIEAGPPGAFFDEAANLLQSDLQQYGIRSKIIHREDTLKIIEDVNDDKSSVEVGFISHDVGSRDYPNVTAIGTIVLEPLFIFCRASTNIKNLQDLKGLRLAVSPPESGTRVLSERILSAYGVDSQNTTFLPLTFTESSEAIGKGSVDAAFFLQPPGNKLIHDLALNTKLQLFSLPQAEALASNLGFVRHVTIHAGGFDYVRNIPDKDVQLVAMPVTLIVKKDLKPAIATVIAQSVKTHFQRATLVSQPDELLTIHQLSIVVNDHAEPVLRSGLPYIYRALPFSFAALLDNFSVYIGFIIFLVSVYSSMRFPSPQLIWRDIQLKWYVFKLERLLDDVVRGGRTIDAKHQQLIEKVYALANQEEARLNRVSRLLADLKARGVNPNTSPSP